MNTDSFIVVGENIHCTRIVKRGGARMTTADARQEAVTFTYQGEDRLLMVPENWDVISPAFKSGKCKHVALAIWQALHGNGDNQQAGLDYIQYVAEAQIQKGATFLDVNVDEYASDPKVTIEIMGWLCQFLSERYDTPLSIDSSNPDLIAAGLANCRKDIRPPMVNSVSLERMDIIGLIKQYEADAIVGASGHHDLPADAQGRLDNLAELMPAIEQAGISRCKLHIDPLVLPISTDSTNGKHFLDATRFCKERYPECHFNGGLSNVSFGMPNRKLLNMVFIWLCMDAGTDGGIIDPVVISPAAVTKLDPESEPFRLAKAVLTGEDIFGMDYITAHREGRLKL